jgi:hypothetical protein
MRAWTTTPSSNLDEMTGARSVLAGLLVNFIFLLFTFVAYSFVSCETPQGFHTAGSVDICTYMVVLDKKCISIYFSSDPRTVS